MANSIGNRLYEFIIKNYGSVKEFAQISGISESSISRYINNKSSPSQDKLEILIDMGMSVDWWLSGNGKMYANNKAGHLLQKKYISESQDTAGFDSPRKRALLWIFEYYENLENFCLIWDCNLEEIYNFLYNNHLPNPYLIQTIEDSGCNRNWLSTGKGKKFADNIAGTIIELKFDDSTGKADSDIKEIISQYYKDDISYISQKELFGILEKVKKNK